jgi:hypothetical protein
MRFLLVCALILSGCAAPRQQDSTEAIAQQKQRTRAEREKRMERDDQKLRLALRQFYINEHPALSADFRKAILKERLKVGMTMWDVIAAYSLWEYTTDSRVAKYRESGVVGLWTLADRRQTTTAQVRLEEWIMQRKKDTQHLYFESGTLTAWKD